jgi:hypothetical protein
LSNLALDDFWSIHLQLLATIFAKSPELIRQVFCINNNIMAVSADVGGCNGAFMSTNASIKSISPLEIIENHICDLNTCQDNRGLPKLWLLFLIVRDGKIWQYSSEYRSFDQYAHNTCGYGRSQANNLAIAGRAIYVLLKHPDFGSSRLPLPRRLDLSLSLSKHPQHTIFTLWQDYYEKGIKIPRVNVPRNERRNAGQALNIEEALDLIKLIY